MTDYGTELSCVNDIASDGRMVSGFAVVAEALVRRLQTPRGRLIGDPNYGMDLRQYINADMSPRDIVGLRAAVSAECAKDDRVVAVKTLADLDDQGVLTLTIGIDLGKESFTLVVSASDVTVDLVSVTP